MLDKVTERPARTLRPAYAQPSSDVLLIAALPALPLDMARLELTSSERTASDTPSDVETIVPPSILVLGELANHYTFGDREAVTGFLLRHPDLVLPLLAAHEQIRVHFPRAQAILDMDTGYDESTNRQRLMVFIVTDMNVREAVARLRAFDYDWWLDQPQSRDGLVLITLE